jgi:hypothetical protein
MRHNRHGVGGLVVRRPSSPLFDTPDAADCFRSAEFDGKMPKQESQLTRTSSN